MNDSRQDPFVRALEARAAALDGATLSRLRQARARAAAEGARGRWRPRARHWAGGLGLAASLLLAVLLWPGVDRPAPPAADELIEVATLDVDLEVLEELDFYEWLSEQDMSGARRGDSA